ncbi:MAG: oxidoreductase protein [uncultured bacterium]|nr:MAG: oxidoreductase protein [uncultured bacterium]OGT55275.1 MAG: hypothetical protein A3F43_03385 [Gammaproteobacteria bacterium RIFCSPHIGHO2_12_FULL_42_10]
MKTIGIIGYGYWGAVLLRNFSQHKEFEVKYICDRNLSKLEQAKNAAPTNCILLNAPKDIFEDTEVDLVVIATQAAHHFNLAMMALEADKHVFIEKPLVLSSQEAKMIFQLANERDRKVWIDHTFLFASAYQKLKNCLHWGMIGKPLRFHSTRTAFGLFQQDANILWHLMYHDIYILLDLFHIPDKLNSVVGSASIIPNMIDSVLASFSFSNGLHATIHCDMLFAEKKREIVITGDKGILVWDELCQNKLMFYPYCAQYHSAIKKVTYQIAEVEKIQIEQSEALINEINELSKFLNNKKCKVSVNENIALDIINLLESVEARLIEGRICQAII